MFRRIALLGVLAASQAIATAPAVGYAATSAQSGTIVIHVITKWVVPNSGGVLERLEEDPEGTGPPVIIVRVGRGEPFRLETQQHRLQVAPGRYQLVLETHQGPWDESRELKVKAGQRVEVRFTWAEVKGNTYAFLSR